MYLNSTPCTDGFNRQVHIRNKNSCVTNCIGQFKAFDFLRQSGGYDIIKSVIAPTLPYKKCRDGRNQFGNFIQRLAGILIGKEPKIPLLSSVQRSVFFERYHACRLTPLIAFSRAEISAVSSACSFAY